MTAIKLCGVTRPDDAAYAAAVGVDYLGFNFWPQSKRVAEEHLARGAARAARTVRPDIRLVGVFVDQPVAEIERIAAKIGLDIVQLHGDEPAQVAEALTARGLEVWRAVGVAVEDDLDLLASYPATTFVLDAKSPARGGTGTSFDHALAARAVAAGHRIVLAGGLTPSNVANAIMAVLPFAVDVASGVESAPGVKDPAKVYNFVQAVRRKVSYLKKR